MSGADTVVSSRLFEAQYMQDPYPVYASLRGERSVYRATTPSGLPVWVVTRYQEVRAALTDPALVKSAERIRAIVDGKVAQGGRPPSASETIAGHMLNSDPPQHTRLRKLVLKAFTARRVEKLRPRIEEITDRLLDALATRGAAGRPVDLLGDFAFPLAFTVICELLGIPQTERDTFRMWSNTLVGAGPPQNVRQVSIAMGGYLMQLVQAKRAGPTDDLLSDLIGANEEGDRLDSVELVAMVMLLLVAGYETTVNLIGNGVHALLGHPEQLAALREDPGKLTDAIEEVLRFNSPAPVATMRYTGRPVSIGDVLIPAGELVYLALGAGNHDDERFADPGRFDIGRPAGGHLSFGHGIHHCLGAPLARLEAQIALGRLLARFGQIRLAVSAEHLRWRPSVIMRGLEKLPVLMTPGARQHQTRETSIGGGMNITTERMAQVKKVVCATLELDEREVTETSLFNEDHAADSLQAIEVLSALELEFDVTIDQDKLPRMVNVAETYQVVAEVADWT